MTLSIAPVLAEAMNSMSPTDDEKRAASERYPEARGIRSRLPAFLTQPPPAQLMARVSDPRVTAAVSWWNWGSGSLLIVGKSGIGKSSAAGWLFRKLLGLGMRSGGDEWDRARGLYWFSAEDLARSRLEHALGRGDAPEILQAERASLLFLDDLGWDRDPSVVSTVLASRYESARPTIVTSGRVVRELSEMYGAPVLRRLNDSGGRGSMTIVDCFQGAK